MCQNKAVSTVLAIVFGYAFMYTLIVAIRTNMNPWFAAFALLVFGLIVKIASHSLYCNCAANSYSIKPQTKTAQSPAKSQRARRRAKRRR